MPSRYETPVDRGAANNAHAFMLGMVGWNRKVLELGAASGYITRALVEQGCRVTAVEYDPEAAADLKAIADEVIVGDLNDPHVFGELPGQFDVVLAGDVLEHLLYPQQVLSRSAQLLAPGGRVVVSLPHVGHVDLRLSLLQGRFDYHSVGLLDDTHIRFFTLKTIKQMVHQSGLIITDLQRVRIPAFETELGVERSTVATAVLNAALADPEAETYQFVFTAVKDDGAYRTAALAERSVELQEQLNRALISARAAEIALARGHQDKTDRTRELSELLEAERHQRHQLETEMHAISQTKTFRYTSVLRRIYGRMRAVRG